MVSLALPDILLLVFPAAVLGGLSSLPGSILGSVITATLLTLCGYFFGGQWANVMASVVLLGVLIVRPFGLMGTSSAQRLQLRKVNPMQHVAESNRLRVDGVVLKLSDVLITICSWPSLKGPADTITTSLSCGSGSSALF
ncbi:hypothetical protein [Streptomyces sp. NPDC055006]